MCTVLFPLVKLFCCAVCILSFVVLLILILYSVLHCKLLKSKASCVSDSLCSLWCVRVWRGESEFRAFRTPQFQIVRPAWAWGVASGARPDSGRVV